MQRRAAVLYLLPEPILPPYAQVLTGVPESLAGGDAEAGGGTGGGGDATAGNSLRTAASGGSATLSRQGSAASPQAVPEASLRSYNLRVRATPCRRMQRV